MRSERPLDRARAVLRPHVLIGVPFLLPSIVYEGVHATRHDHAVFGTDGDPEYVRLDGTGHRTHVAVA